MLTQTVLTQMPRLGGRQWRISALMRRRSGMAYTARESCVRDTCLRYLPSGEP
jgi:hypothetical protein